MWIVASFVLCSVAGLGALIVGAVKSVVLTYIIGVFAMTFGLTVLIRELYLKKFL